MAERIIFRDVWKAYPRWRGRTVRDALERRLPTLLGGAQHWALRGVTFSVGRGEFIGVVGQNGAGKSTLLRLAAGLSCPSRGQVLLPYDTAAVLSLGGLFDPSLSGRENALTAALAVGVSVRRARALVPQAFAFAELEGFEDAPLRSYSDGMQLRLAFGILAQLRPDALLLDEVMAVGDLRFQQKCIEYVRERCADGAGVLFASHSLEQVACECSKAVRLEAGAVRAFGPAEDVVSAYRKAMDSETRKRTPPPTEADEGLELQRNRFGTQQAVIERVELRDGMGLQIAELSSGEPLEVSFIVRVPSEEPVRSPIAGVTISRSTDGTVCYDTNSAGEGLFVDEIAGERRFTIHFDRLDLIPGKYFVDVGIYEGNWKYAYDYHWHVYPLRVLGSSSDGGVFRPPHHWGVDPPAAGEVASHVGLAPGGRDLGARA